MPDIVDATMASGMNKLADRYRVFTNIFGAY